MLSKTYSNNGNEVRALKFTDDIEELSEFTECEVAIVEDQTLVMSPSGVFVARPDSYVVIVDGSVEAPVELTIFHSTHTVPVKTIMTFTDVEFESNFEEKA